ncbi:MAG: hypothetical protein PVH61_33990 [Candidatus Aminicenantes bacterium]
MMTTKILLVFQMLLLSSFIFGVKVAVLPEINHPYGFRVDGDRYYVTEGVTIFIYSTKDYQLKKKFGKEGEGPGEILLDRHRGNDEIGISIRPDYLIVNSVFKVLYFTKQGEYVKEIKIAESGGRLVEPLGNQFVGKTFKNENGKLYHGIALYDANLEKVKEIYSHKHGWQGAEAEFNPLTIEQAAFEICDDKIFVLDGARTMVMAFNSKGEKLFTITHNNDLVKFTDKHKEEMIQNYRLNSMWKAYYERKKRFFKFPGYFPPIRWYYVDPLEKKIYLETEKVENLERKYIVYDFKGKLVKKIMLPTEQKVLGNLTAFYGGKCYKLFENETTEECELYITEVK